MQIKKELAVIALSDSASHPNSYALILEDTESNRRIPIIIGLAEAQAIAVTMERMQPVRPLTHDLMKNTLDVLGVKLKESQAAALMFPFVVPMPYGMAKWGWVNVDFPKGALSKKLVKEWIAESYWYTAPKKLLKLLDSQSAQKK